MRGFIEVLRIVFLFALLGGLGWYILSQVYVNNNVLNEFQWLGAVGIYILLFVLYRNRLQFSGWYKGEGRHRLSKKISFLLIVVGILLLITPFIVSAILN